MRSRTATAGVVLAAGALLLTSCGNDSTSTSESKKSAAATSIGKTEGALNIVVWAGYAEDGTTDKAVDWVTPFEKATGCQVTATNGTTSDEMVSLMQSGKYDGVSASGDATLRLIAGGEVAPVNTKLIPNYADVYSGLKDKPHNTVDGVNYGVPHGRGANLLQYRTDKVMPAPDSWAPVWEADSKYAGQVTAYDSPIYIADAALYLKATQPDLKIDNVYELDQKQFDAAVKLLKQQRPLVGEYWSDYTKQQSSFAAGDSVIGTTWQVITNLLEGDKVPIANVLPKEGATGWSDTWMLSSKAAHPNCMYKWMDWIISPEVNAQAAEWFGEAPANSKACEKTADKDHCTKFHAADESFFDKVALWTTPVKACGDDRGDVCKDYAEWTKAWTEIKG